MSLDDGARGSSVSQFSSWLKLSLDPRMNRVGQRRVKEESAS